MLFFYFASGRIGSSSLMELNGLGWLCTCSLQWFEIEGASYGHYFVGEIL